MLHVIVGVFEFKARVVATGKVLQLFTITLYMMQY